VAIDRLRKIVSITSRQFFDRAKSGAITPAENQATEIFPKISEVLFSCPIDNFFLTLV
jgi:hypothetical protein